MNKIKKGFNLDCISTKDFNVFIDGRKTVHKTDFLQSFGEQIRGRKYEKWEAFIDDLTDLVWIKNANITIVIFNWSYALSQSQISKKDFIDDLNSVVFKYWNEEEKMPDAEERSLKNISVYITDKSLPDKMVKFYQKNNGLYL